MGNLGRRLEATFVSLMSGVGGRRTFRPVATAFLLRSVDRIFVRFRSADARQTVASSDSALGAGDHHPRGTCTEEYRRARASLEGSIRTTARYPSGHRKW